MKEYTQTDRLINWLPPGPKPMTTLAAIAAIVFAFAWPARAADSVDTPTHSCSCGKGHSLDSEELAPKTAFNAVGVARLLADRPNVTSRTQWGCSDGQSSPLWPAP